MSGWAETTIGDLRVKYKVEEIERGKRRGHRYIAAITVEPDPDTTEYGTSIKAADLARIKPADLLDRHEKARTSFPASPLDASVDGSFRQSPHVQPVLPEPLSDDHIDHIAHMMRWARIAPELGSVSDWIRSHYRVSQATSYRWMATARKKHPDLPGKSRGPTPKEDKRGATRG